MVKAVDNEKDTRSAGRQRRANRRAAAHPPSLDATLRAKLHVPPPRHDWIGRPGLLADLDRSTAARLVLVVAPAGSGKSTLLALWRAHSPHPTAVYAADERDNDCVVLWTGLLQALARAVPDLDVDDMIDLLALQQIDIAGVLLPALVDQLESVGGPLALVIDDYHRITSRPCQEHLRSLLTGLPPSCRLVLATRTVPRHLPIARLRAAGDLVEIGPGDLRLTAAETGELLQRITGTELESATVDRLAAATEGWATGVQLAALAARGHGDPEAVLSRFGGSHRDVHDYLVEQVLADLPEDQAAALTRLSITDRFCAELCQALTGDDWSPLVDDDAPQLFLVPLDDQRRWYRYHQLFQQTLRDRLQRTEPRLIPTLHQRAATWYQQHGLVGEAIDHALAAGEVATATDLLAHNYVVYVTGGRVATVAAWLDRLGPEATAASAPTAICAAWVAGLGGDRDGFRRWLQTAERLGHDGPLPDGTRSVTSAVALARALFGFDGLGTMLDAAHTATRLETDPASPWHGVAHVALGLATYLAGHTDQALPPLEAAVRSPATMPLLRVAGFAVQALVALDLERHDQAAELATAAYRLVEEYGLAEAPQASVAHTALGVVAAQRGDHATAVAHLQKSLATRRRIPGISPWPTLASLLQLARVQHSLGDTAAATALLDEADGLLAGLPAERTRAHQQVDRLRQALHANRSRRAPAQPLTDRELAVLRLLPAPLSRREIAQQLYVSVNTIKTQTSSIYRKLDASNRIDAVHRARTLGILA